MLQFVGILCFMYNTYSSMDKEAMVNGWLLNGMSQDDMLEDHGDYKINPLVTSSYDSYIGHVSYMWHPQIVNDIKHTTEWFNDTVTATNNTMDIIEIFELIENNWFILTQKEKEFLNYTYINGGKLDQALVYIVNVRTNTGFTTHGHSAVDVSVYATGVSADSFIGHWSNDEIGQLLSRIMDCVDQQNEQTALLQEMFISNRLELCDAKQKIPIIEWNNSVPYPWGNLLYPQNCVDQWIVDE